MTNLDYALLDFTGKVLTFKEKTEVDKKGKAIKQIEKPITVRKVLITALLGKLQGATTDMNEEIYSGDTAGERYRLACLVRDAKKECSFDYNEVDLICMLLSVSTDVILGGQVINIVKKDNEV